MSTDFLIVSRKQPNLYAYLKDDFASDASVQVIMDRRIGERRRESAPVGAERRRRSDRRMRPDVGEKLRTIGFAIIRVD